ncbi:MAG: DNA replication and repair protein RecF [Candidatus Glassbacteria bacterium]|nr:DNA replication and repair protein RecF [Candidatus Glassbacteria bacterium]
MIIRELNLNNFRTFSEAEIKFADRGNIIIGDNGQGKTNLLEAIHFLTIFRSLRQAADRECISFGEDFFRLSALWIKEEGSSERLAVAFNGRRKKVTCGGSQVRVLSKVFGKFKSVLLSPEDVLIVQQGPAARRKYLDIALSIISPVYLERLKRYRKALASRNYLLRSRSLRTELIRPWEEQMAEEGSRLILERIEYLRLLAPFYRELYARLSTAEKSEIKYYNRLLGPWEQWREGFPDYPGLRELLAGSLEKNRPLERSRGTSLTGPQTDDLVFGIDGRPMRSFGSQGQQRTAVICLKIAEAGLLQERWSVNAVLLLDDIFAELDCRRSERLLQELVDRHQSFITAPRREAILGSLSHLPVKSISNGVVTGD